MEQSTPFAIGMDIGDRFSEICVLDPSGEVIQRTQVPTTKSAVRRFFEHVERGRVAMEVGAESVKKQRELSAVGLEVYVANARKLRAIWDNDKKSDRTDAHLLAEIVQLKPSLLRPITHRGEGAQHDLSLIRTRAALVRSRTLLINHVRGSAKSVGGRVATCDASMFHKTADTLPDDLRTILEPIVRYVGQVTALIRGYDKAIEDRTKTDPAVTRLRQVKGVGALTALAFVATVEDPSRFPQTRKIGSYLGLRPRLDKSCTIDKQMRITKAGDTHLRQLLVISAQYILGVFGPDTDLRRWGLKLAETGGKNAKKRAVVAVARKLAVLLLTLWKTGATYDPLRQAKRNGTGAVPVQAKEGLGTQESNEAIVPQEPTARAVMEDTVTSPAPEVRAPLSKEVRSRERVIRGKLLKQARKAPRHSTCGGTEAMPTDRGKGGPGSRRPRRDDRPAQAKGQ